MQRKIDLTHFKRFLRCNFTKSESFFFSSVYHLVIGINNISLSSKIREINLQVSNISFKALLLCIVVTNVLFSDVFAQNGDFNRVYLRSQYDQLRFEVSGENRYWIMSKTVGGSNKAFALYSPDEGGWFSHWEAGSGDLIMHKGNLGIGAQNPFSGTNNVGLQISKGYHSSVLLGDPISSGYGGILQTSDSKHRVFIGANIYDDEVNAWSSFASNKGSAGISIIADEGNWGSQITFIASEQDGHYSRRMVINGNGKVGIGTTSPDEKLTVAGTVKSKEVIVEENIGADFVFEQGYELPDLSELETFIKSNKHLPEIPTADQMKKEGVKVGELQIKLLQKIEELTLYAIQENRSKSILEDRIEAQQKTINMLVKQIEKLESKLETP